MPTEVPRCIDCGTPLKAVPAWLAPAKVSFTCGSCPRRSTRTATARLEKPVELKAAPLDDLDVEDVDELDEDADLDIGEEELEDVKDDAEL